IYMLWDQCRAFAKLVDSFVNYTTDSLKIINTELSAMREVVMQNRIAWDSILAETNGVCGMFGDECCVYIPDGTVPLARNIEHIQKAVAQYKLDTTSVVGTYFDQSFSTLTTGIGGWIVKILIVIIVIVLLIGILW
ncbi:hypothetical protein JRQ81_000854, partial [Phrynocephalus forsythii]